MFIILTDVTDRVRKILYDNQTPYRWTNDMLLDELNDGVLDIKMERGDLRYDENHDFEEMIPSYTLPTDWLASTAYVAGDRVKKTTGDDYEFYVCTVNGTSGATEPTWNNVINTDTTDNTVTWQPEVITINKTDLMTLVYYMVANLFRYDDADTLDTNKHTEYWEKYQLDLHGR